MPKVKICGNTNVADTKQAIELGADFAGFIFSESKRRITTDKAKEIMSVLGSFKGFVGVFANQSKEEVELISTTLGLKWLQFHGDETSRYCRHFSNSGFKVIKTFHIKDALSLKRLDEYDVDAFLFDTYSGSHLGGTGTTFNWSVIESKPYVHEKLFLAGGLTPANLKEAIDQVKPYAVDVASGVEKSPGIKDAALLERFIAIAKGKG